MKSKGFTLIELMIVIVIISILAAVIIPALKGEATVSSDEAANAFAIPTARPTPPTSTESCIGGVKVLVSGTATTQLLDPQGHGIPCD